MLPDALLTDYLARVPWLGPRALHRLQQADAGVEPTDWAAIARSVSDRPPTALSVDVFDTCLIRDLVGDRVVERVIDRSHAAAPQRSRDRVAEELERALCRPVPGAAAALAAVRAAEVEVVFLSDTDRSSALLIELLARHGLFVDGDRLVASCEAGAAKWTGDLYGRTWPDTAQRRSVRHVGNNPWADVAMAAAAGVRPIPFRDADANRYEQAMAVGQDGYGPALAAAARKARLGVEQQQRSRAIDDRQARLRVLGADVAGQTMTAFVLWIAERCREEEIEHLAFLARDGELPLEVARAIPADHWEGRSLRYLHCSRSTWSLAAASAIGVDRWVAAGTRDGDAYLHTNRHDVPLRVLLGRVGLAVTDLSGEPGHAALARSDPDAPLPPVAVADWEALLADPLVHERIDERSTRRRALIVDWLRSEGIPSGRFGLVDVGWRGQFAAQVSAVLGQVVGQEPVHLHFGGDGVVPEVDAAVSIRRFAFDGRSAPDPIANPVSCVETLTASGKPRVIDHRRTEDGRVELVFDRPAAGRDGDRADLWAGAIAAAQQLPSRAQLDAWHLAPRSLDAEVRAVLDHWWNRPTVEEVRALAGLRFEHDEAGASFRPLVNPYRASELFGDRSEARRQWPQGSAAVSGRFMAGVAGAVRRYRRWRSTGRI